MKSNNDIQTWSIELFTFFESTQTFNQITNKLRIYHWTYTYRWSKQYTYNIETYRSITKRVINIILNHKTQSICNNKCCAQLIINIVHNYINHIILKSYSQLSYRSPMYFPWVKYSTHNSSTRTCCLPKSCWPSKYISLWLSRVFPLKIQCKCQQKSYFQSLFILSKSIIFSLNYQANQK